MIEVQWANEQKTIIFCKFPQKWAIQDLYDWLKEIDKLAETIEHEVYVIIDLLDAGAVPSGIFSSVKGVSMKLHPRIKMIVDVTDSLMVETTTNIFKKVGGIKIDAHFTNTLEEAYAFIQKDIAKSNVDTTS